MLKVYKAPEPIELEPTELVVFLGGSIEMGAAENWQDRIATAVEDLDVTLLNPRRDDWDSSWVQDPTPGTQFHDQVAWELDGQTTADIIVYYFDPNTKSPITLLELGLFGDHHVIVCCPQTFWRYGNVAIVCQWVGATLVHTFDELVEELRKNIQTS